MDPASSNPVPVPSASRETPPPPALAPTPLQRRLPNILTVARVFLAIGFFASLAGFDYERSLPLLSLAPVPRQHPFLPQLVVAASLFAVAALTDLLDGYLARKWRVTSAFGRIMDPFADKLLVISAFILLAGPGFSVGGRAWSIQVSGAEPWVVAVILARELLITSIRAVLESDGVKFPATMSGKLKMVLQSVCVPTILGILSFAPAVTWPEGGGGAVRTPAGWFIAGLVWLTVLVTVWSGWPYVRHAAALMNTRSDAAPGTDA
ncbi:MAG: CDP-diacylglycerol--glycerol-3-phosphate 3-phosphatidyltransferase [Phycisphaeraceae bacterium]|nr:CDP-diacylglycerol--glycerol-3-phosphate 3-phosphatidyltransferase [Phycisphaeraceae bacterium]